MLKISRYEPPPMGQARAVNANTGTRPSGTVPAGGAPTPEPAKPAAPAPASPETPDSAPSDPETA